MCAERVFVVAKRNLSKITSNDQQVGFLLSSRIITSLSPQPHQSTESPEHSLAFPRLQFKVFARWSSTYHRLLRIFEGQHQAKRVRKEQNSRADSKQKNKLRHMEWKGKEREKRTMRKPARSRRRKKLVGGGSERSERFKCTHSGALRPQPPTTSA